MATFVCPACWKVTEMPDDMEGRRARCPECHATGPVSPRGTVAAPAARRESGPTSVTPLPLPRTPREAPAQVLPPKPPVSAAQVWRRVTDIAWGICILWTLGVLVHFTWSANSAATWDYQVLLALRAGVDILAGFVLARAIHGIAAARSRD